VSETDTYDIAGNELTSTDAYGITTNSQIRLPGQRHRKLAERLGLIPEGQLDDDDLRCHGVGH